MAIINSQNLQISCWGDNFPNYNKHNKTVFKNEVSFVITYALARMTMADPNDQWEDNVAGFIVAGRRISFYVDRECILCSVCSDAAPNNS